VNLNEEGEKYEWMIFKLLYVFWFDF